MPRPHELGCDEYHQHVAPKCCSPKCWCQQQEEEVERRIKEAFFAGYRAGDYDGGDQHDCRMFTPTPEAAWEDYQRRERQKHE